MSRKKLNPQRTLAPFLIRRKKEEEEEDEEIFPSTPPDVIRERDLIRQLKDRIDDLDETASRLRYENQKLENTNVVLVDKLNKQDDSSKEYEKNILLCKQTIQFYEGDYKRIVELVDSTLEKNAPIEMYGYGQGFFDKLNNLCRGFVDYANAYPKCENMVNSLSVELEKAKRELGEERLRLSDEQNTSSLKTKRWNELLSTYNRIKAEMANCESELSHAKKKMATMEKEHRSCIDDYKRLAKMYDECSDEYDKLKRRYDACLEYKRSKQ